MQDYTASIHAHTEEQKSHVGTDPHRKFLVLHVAGTITTGHRSLPGKARSDLIGKTT